jgi:hypothetical protein
MLVLIKPGEHVYNHFSAASRMGQNMKNPLHAL